MPDAPPPFLREFGDVSADRIEWGQICRRDVMEMLTLMASHRDQLKKNPSFPCDAHSIFPFMPPDPAGLPPFTPAVAFMLESVFQGASQILEGLDADDTAGYLQDLEMDAKRSGFERVAVLAREARIELAGSALDPKGSDYDVALVVLLRLRELVQLLGDLLGAFVCSREWLEQLSEALDEAVAGEEEDVPREPLRDVPEHGPPPPIFLRVLLPNAPPERFFSAPWGDPAEMRLSQVTEGLMAA